MADDLPADVQALVDERAGYARSGRKDRVIPVDEELAARGWCVNTAGNPVPVDKDRRATTADADVAARAAREAEAEAKKAAKVQEDAQKAAAIAARDKAVADEAAKRAAVNQHIAEGKAAEDEPRPRERAVRRAPEKAVPKD